MTLLYAAHDPRVNHAAVLCDYLLEYDSQGTEPPSDGGSEAVT